MLHHKDRVNKSILISYLSHVQVYIIAFAFVFDDTAELVEGKGTKGIRSTLEFNICKREFIIINK